MDPVTTSALTATITALLGGAAGEAGKQAWQSLVARTREILGREAPAAEALAALPPTAGPAEVHGVAELLSTQAAEHPDLRQWLQDWLAAKPAGGGVTNIVTGNVGGPVVQARDINGGISFGR